MSKLLLSLFKTFVAVLCTMLSPSVVKHALDKAFDLVEDKIQATTNPFDDALLPLLTVLRGVLGIPDTGEFADTVDTAAGMEEEDVESSGVED